MLARRRFLLLSYQIVVIDEFVAVGDEKVRGGILDANANDSLVVFAQLGYER